MLVKANIFADLQKIIKAYLTKCSINHIKI